MSLQTFGFAFHNIGKRLRDSYYVIWMVTILVVVSMTVLAVTRSNQRMDPKAAAAASPEALGVSLASSPSLSPSPSGEQNKPVEQNKAPEPNKLVTELNNLLTGNLPVEQPQIGFEIKIDNDSAGANSDLTFEISEEGPSDLIKIFEIDIPKGWNVTSGEQLGVGTLVGDGKLTNAGKARNVTIFNIAETQGHKARFQIIFGDIQRATASRNLESFIDGDSSSGYKWLIDREPFINLATPVILELRLFGKLAEKSILTNPNSGGDYQFGLKVTFLDGTNSSFDKTVSIK